MTSEEFRRHGYALVDWVADYWSGLAEQRVTSAAPPGTAAAALPAGPPADGDGFAGLLDAYGLATVEHARQHEMVDPVLWERTDALRPSTLTRIVRARVSPG